jgi:hypothetical protein
LPSLKFKCTPTPSAGVARANSTAESNAAPLANKDVLVTIPLRFASAMPRFTPSAHPKSSAFTIKFLTFTLFDAYSLVTCPVGQM